MWRGAGGAPVSAAQRQATRPGTDSDPTWTNCSCPVLGCTVLSAERVLLLGPPPPPIHPFVVRQSASQATSIQPASLLPISSPAQLSLEYDTRTTTLTSSLCISLFFRILALAHLDDRAVPALASFSLDSLASASRHLPSAFCAAIPQPSAAALARTHPSHSPTT